MNKEVKQLIAGIENVEGVELRGGKNGHIAVWRNGKFVTSISGTPGDSRWKANTLAALRRAGIEPPKGKATQFVALGWPVESVEQIRKIVRAMNNRAAFARFLVVEMPKRAPGLKTYKTTRSAEASLHQLVTGTGSGLRPWTHLLLDEALRQWEQAPPAESNGGGAAAPTEAPEAVSEAEEAGASVTDAGPVELLRFGQMQQQIIDAEPDPIITDEELDEAIAIDRKQSPTATMVELATVHEELTKRIERLAGSVKSLTVQLDELVVRREEVAAGILGHLSEKEGKP